MWNAIYEMIMVIPALCEGVNFSKYVFSTDLNNFIIENTFDLLGHRIRPKFSRRLIIGRFFLNLLQFFGLPKTYE